MSDVSASSVWVDIVPLILQAYSSALAEPAAEDVNKLISGIAVAATPKETLAKSIQTIGVSDEFLNSNLAEAESQAI